MTTDTTNYSQLQLLDYLMNIPWIKELEKAKLYTRPKNMSAEKLRLLIKQIENPDICNSEFKKLVMGQTAKINHLIQSKGSDALQVSIISSPWIWTLIRSEIITYQNARKLDVVKFKKINNAQVTNYLIAKEIALSFIYNADDNVLLNLTSPELATLHFENKISFAQIKNLLPKGREIIIKLFRLIKENKISALELIDYIEQKNAKACANLLLTQELILKNQLTVGQAVVLNTTQRKNLEATIKLVENNILSLEKALSLSPKQRQLLAIFMPLFVEASFPIDNFESLTESDAAFFQKARTLNFDNRWIIDVLKQNINNAEQIKELVIKQDLLNDSVLTEVALITNYLQAVKGITLSPTLVVPLTSAVASHAINFSDFTLSSDNFSLTSLFTESIDTKLLENLDWQHIKVYIENLPNKELIQQQNITIKQVLDYFVNGNLPKLKILENLAPDSIARIKSSNGLDVFQLNEMNLQLLVSDEINTLLSKLNLPYSDLLHLSREQIRDLEAKCKQGNVIELAVKRLFTLEELLSTSLDNPNFNLDPNAIVATQYLIDNKINILNLNEAQRILVTSKSIANISTYENYSQVYANLWSEERKAIISEFIKTLDSNFIKQVLRATIITKETIIPLQQMVYHIAYPGMTSIIPMLEETFSVQAEMKVDRTRKVSHLVWLYVKNSKVTRLQITTVTMNKLRLIAELSMFGEEILKLLDYEVNSLQDKVSQPAVKTLIKQKLLSITDVMNINMNHPIFNLPSRATIFPVDYLLKKKVNILELKDYQVKLITSSELFKLSQILPNIYSFLFCLSKADHNNLTKFKFSESLLDKFSEMHVFSTPGNASSEFFMEIYFKFLSPLNQIKSAIYIFNQYCKNDYLVNYLIKTGFSEEQGNEIKGIMTTKKKNIDNIYFKEFIYKNGASPLRNIAKTIEICGNKTRLIKAFHDAFRMDPNLSDIDISGAFSLKVFNLLSSTAREHFAACMKAAKSPVAEFLIVATHINYYTKQLDFDLIANKIVLSPLKYVVLYLDTLNSLLIKSVDALSKILKVYKWAEADKYYSVDIFVEPLKSSIKYTINNLPNLVNFMKSIPTDCYKGVFEAVIERHLINTTDVLQKFLANFTLEQKIIVLQALFESHSLATMTVNNEKKNILDIIMLIINLPPENCGYIFQVKAITDLVSSADELNKVLAALPSERCKQVTTGLLTHNPNVVSEISSLSILLNKLSIKQFRETFNAVCHVCPKVISNIDDIIDLINSPYLSVKQSQELLSICPAYIDKDELHVKAQPILEKKVAQKIKTPKFFNHSIPVNKTADKLNEESDISISTSIGNNWV